jgi:hypothetical protein
VRLIANALGVPVARRAGEGVAGVMETRLEKCAYARCGTKGPLNDNGICARCAMIVKRVRWKLASSHLPRMPTATLTPREKIRVTPIPRPGSGIPCAACGEAINEEHWSYPDFPRGGRPRGLDLHFHKLCEEIWQMEV